ncbi:hypothetical protein IKE96_02200 [bacterium]|nr:hypothetical protein [bacterium]MBR2857989.1 hypothetical protein [bacterium]
MNEENFINKLSTSLKGDFIGSNKVVSLIKKKLKLSGIKEFLTIINADVYNDPQLIN